MTSQFPYLSDPQRLHALYRSMLLDSPPEPAFDRITRLVVKLLRVPVAAISFLDQDRHIFKSQIGLGEPFASSRELPMTHSLCAMVVDQQTPLVLDDTRADPRAANNRAVSDLGVLAYAGFPLHAATGETLGSCCALDTAPRVWSEDELAILGDLARVIETEMALRSTVQTLQEAEAERQELQDELLMAQATVVRELSTPLLPIAEQVLVMPVLGTLDAYRAGLLKEGVQAVAEERGASWLILDLTRLIAVTPPLVSALQQSSRLAQTAGIELLLAGAWPDTLEQLAVAGVTTAMVVHPTLQSAVSHAMQSQPASPRA